MATKIKVLKTNGVNGLTVHEVGVNGVTEIRDTGIESEQNTVICFTIYVDGKMKYEYINGVYEIEYES